MDLLDALERSRALGFLGPGPVERHVAHAEAFVAALDRVVAGRVVDLGAGGGVPGLVLAARRPDLELVLVDAQAKRTAFLEAVLAALGWADRVSVRTGRAEELGRDASLRHRAAAVVARSFGAPAVTAECGAPFLAVGGVLVVAEPPGGDPARWPAGGLAELGLVDAGVLQRGAATVRCLEARTPCSERYPRANGVPGKRPLFSDTA